MEPVSPGHARGLPSPSATICPVAKGSTGPRRSEARQGRRGQNKTQRSRGGRELLLFDLAKLLPDVCGLATKVCAPTGQGGRGWGPEAWGWGSGPGPAEPGFRPWSLDAPAVYLLSRGNQKTPRERVGQKKRAPAVGPTVRGGSLPRARAVAGVGVQSHAKASQGRPVSPVSPSQGPSWPQGGIPGGDRRRGLEPC